VLEDRGRELRRANGGKVGGPARRRAVIAAEVRTEGVVRDP